MMMIIKINIYIYNCNKHSILHNDADDIIIKVYYIILIKIIII